MIIYQEHKVSKENIKEYLHIDAEKWNLGKWIIQWQLVKWKTVFERGMIIIILHYKQPTNLILP